MEDIRTAMGELMAIHNQQVQVLLAGDFSGVADLDTTLQRAREHKESLIELYREHVLSHGC